ncbi:hypothetical protein TKK_0005612 [Trichogramma kaykai]|uniref:C2H2-type domain-containing protein n=1 Tax=Trichogramma kaykai TaxID=54128 RepID=A0ABD2XHF8_9HYME
MSLSSYPCHRCKVYFSSEDASMYHHRHNHPNEPDPIKLDQSHPSLTETSPRDAGEYVCEMCFMSFKTRKLLRTHQILTHPGLLGGHEFDACHRTFLGSDDLMRNKIELCDNESKYKCDVCHEAFTLQSLLKNHQKLSHPEPLVHECNVCHKLFSRQTDLIKHKVGPCGKGNNFECDVCHKLFSSQTDLMKHKVGPCGKLGNLFECGACQKVFLRRPDLITHKQKWHNERIKYECDVCHRGFISQSLLLGHQRFYEGRKVHEYKVQDKEFMKRYYMTKHYISSKHRVWKRPSS